MRWIRKNREIIPGQAESLPEKKSVLEQCSQFALAVWLVFFVGWLSVRLLLSQAIGMSAMSDALLRLWLGETGILVAVLLLRLLLLSVELWLLERARRALQSGKRTRRRGERRKRLL